MKQTIGVMMVIRNEKDRIKKCLSHHLPYVDQVAICDQMSDDGTWEIISKYKKESKIPFFIIRDKKWGYCEPSKQKTANLLTTDWVLYVDADEKFSIKFLETMHKTVSEDIYDGFTFKRDTIFVAKVYDDTVPIGPKFLRMKHPAHDYQLRLTKRKLSIFPKFMHNRVRISKKVPNIAKISLAIQHVKSLTEQWQDLKRYSLINK